MKVSFVDKLYIKEIWHLSVFGFCCWLVYKLIKMCHKNSGVAFCNRKQYQLWRTAYWNRKAVQPGNFSWRCLPEVWTHGTWFQSISYWIRLAISLSLMVKKKFHHNVRYWLLCFVMFKLIKSKRLGWTKKRQGAVNKMRCSGFVASYIGETDKILNIRLTIHNWKILYWMSFTCKLLIWCGSSEKQQNHLWESYT